MYGQKCVNRFLRTRLQIVKECLLTLAILVSCNAFAQQPKLVLPAGHAFAVADVSFSSNDKYVATAATDNTIKLWNSVDGQLLRNFTGHTDELKKVRFSANDQLLISLASDRTVKVWNIKEDKLELDIAHEAGITDFVLTHDGKTLIVVGPEHLTIASLETKKITQDNHNKLFGFPQFVALSPDDQQLALLNSSGAEITLYKLATHTFKSLDLDFCPWGAAETFFYNNKTLVTHCKGTNILVTDLDADTTSVISLDSLSVEQMMVLPQQQLIVVHTKNDRMLYGSLASMSHPQAMFQAPFAKQEVNSTSTAGVLLNAAIKEPSGKRYGQDEFDSCFIIRFENEKAINHPLPYNKPYHSAFLSTTGMHVAFTQYNGDVYLVNTASDKITAALTNKLEKVNAMYVPSDSITFTGDGYGMIKKWDLKQGIITANTRVTDSYVEAIDYSALNNRIVAGCGDGSVHILDGTNLKMLLKLQQPKQRVDAVAWAANGKYLAASYTNEENNRRSVKVFDAANGTQMFDRTGYFIRGMNPLAADGSRIHFINDSSVRCYQVASSKPLFTYKCSNRVNTVNNNLQHKKLAVVSGSNITILDGVTGKQLQLFNIPKADFTTAAFSADDTKLAAFAYDGTVTVWDLSKNTRISATKLTPGWGLVKFINANTLMCLVEENVYRFDMLANKTAHLAKGNWLQGWSNVSAWNDLSQLVVVENDASFTLMDINGKTDANKFCAIGDNDFLTLSQQGYYRASENAARSVHYVNDDLKVISFEQLDVRYNRPDKILSSLNNTDTALIRSYNMAYRKRINKLAIDTLAFSEGFGMPETEIVNAATIQPDQQTSQLNLHIKGSDSRKILNQFNIWVNNVPVFGSKGVAIVHRNSMLYDTTVTITLSSGENRIETAVTNVNGTESYRMPLFVRYYPTQPKQSSVYFIGIGIDHFADPSYDLSWSVKDIRDLAAKLKIRYPHILIDTLFNNAVTKENILQLRQHLAQLGEDDKLILSYSGHGILSKQLNYYLSTYNIDFAAPEKAGLAYDELESLVDGIKPRQKLVLIDACHSGEVDKEDIERIELAKKELDKQGVKADTANRSSIKIKKKLGTGNSFELMQSLFVNVSRGTGATIIAASAATQFAQERGDLKNGVFTYSILDAMNKYTTLTVDQLKQLVAESVTRLTNGLQKPASRNSTSTYDWVVW